MQASLSPSPPAQQGASDPAEDMSLAKLSVSAPPARFQHTAPYVIDTHNPWNSSQNSSSSSQTMIPPLQTWSTGGPAYSSYRNEPKLVLHTSNDRQQEPATMLSHHPMSSHRSPDFSSPGPMPFVQSRSKVDSPLLEPAIKQDDSENLSYFTKHLATLPSPISKQGSPATPVHGILDITDQPILHGPPQRGNSSRQMDISSLISSKDLSCRASYKIIIRQQPVAARACGFGERDRRVIDPPPILQMLVQDPDATPAELDTRVRHPFSVIHCDLWNAESDNEENIMSEAGDRPPQRRLMGRLVASPFIGRDENGTDGCFFPFPDLSCRSPGRYRLRFVLVVPYPARMKTGDRLPFRATVLSDVFEVYPAKAFPGMIPSSALAKRLKEQGCLISVKKGHQRMELASERAAKKEEDKEDNDEDDDEDRIIPEVAVGRQKRQKI